LALDPDLALGTHVYVAVESTEDSKAMRWLSVSLAPSLPGTETRSRGRRGDRAEAQPAAQSGRPRETAASVLERFELPPATKAFISDRLLLDALRDKAHYASYMTTQLCFDPGAIATWIAARRAEAIALPVHVGIPGVAEPHKLLAISARIGVADTHRFLSKNIRFVARLMRSGGFYRPDGLLEGLAPHIVDPAARIVDLHLYTFNAVEATEKWRQSMLNRLEG
jgi:hypothetical protein